MKSKVYEIREFYRNTNGGSSDGTFLWSFKHVMFHCSVRFGTGCLYRFDSQVRYDKNLYRVVLSLASFNRFCSERDQDSTKVEFFERLYKMDIQGVKPYAEYQDPETFYSEIARKVGIPQVAHTAVEKTLDGSKTTRDFLCDHD